ncbi:MAG: hypothetical protein ABSE20_25175 [Acetobacteraceae bacterium]|jgi:hypothetical protein
MPDGAFVVRFDPARCTVKIDGGGIGDNHNGLCGIVIFDMVGDTAGGAFITTKPDASKCPASR